VRQRPAKYTEKTTAPVLARFLIIEEASMKRYFFLILCVFCAAGAFAKDNLAVLPFTGGQGEEGETIAEIFSFEPKLMAAFNLVPRMSINRVIQSQRRFQPEFGMIGPDAAADIGKELDVQYLVSGSITALGKQKLLIIALFRIDGFRQMTGDIQTYADIEEIQGKLPGMAQNIATAALTDVPNLPRLAVAPMTLSGGADPQTADALARILAIHIIRSGKYRVYPRAASLEQMQEEYANQVNGDGDGDGDTADKQTPATDLGTLPELALSVTARKLGNRNMFNAAIINLITGMQETGESVNYQSLNDGLRVMEDLGLALGGQKKAIPAFNNEKEYAVSDPAAFTRAIAAVNAESGGGDFTITLAGSFAAAPVAFSGGAVKTITLQGKSANRTITNNGNAALFTVPRGVTLVLDDNLVLNGNNKTAALVFINGVTLIMKAGVVLQGSARGGVVVSGGGSFTMSGGAISGNTGSYNGGGGVYVLGGNFTMSGGMISGNTTTGSGGGVYVGDGSFAMSGGTISGNMIDGYGGTVYSDFGGGGVYVGGGGSFTMSGGTISGNWAVWSGGVYVSFRGSFAKRGGGTIDADGVTGRGSVVFVNNGDKARNSAAGPMVDMDSGVAGRAGGWE
jgi:hypothetical protein